MAAVIDRVRHSEDVKLGLIVYPSRGEEGDVYMSTPHEVSRRGAPETTVVVIDGVQYPLLDVLRRAKLLSY